MNNLRTLFIFLSIFSLFSLNSCTPEGVDWKTLDVVDLEGNEVDMSRYEGKRIVLNFWATWCGPCRAEMPSLEQARQELESEDIAFVLVSDEPLDILNMFEEKTSFGFDYLKMNISIKTRGVFSIPHTFIIDSNGKVQQSINGMVEWHSEQSLAMLKSIP